MIHQGIFNLYRENIFTAAGDHILGAVDDVKVSLFVGLHQITGIQPVVYKRFLGQIRVLIIAFHHAVGFK